MQEPHSPQVYPLQLKYPGYNPKIKHRKSLKGGKIKPGCLENLRFEEQHVSEFPCCLLYIPDMVLQKNPTWNC